MKQNNDSTLLTVLRRIRWDRLLAILPPFLFAAYTVHRYINHFFTETLTPDASAYCEEIMGICPISNWWSSFFMWEGRALLTSGRIFIDDLTARPILYAFAILSVILLYGSIASITLLSAQRNRFLSLLSVPACYIASTYYFVRWWGGEPLRLDIIGGAFLISGVTLALYIYEKAQKNLLCYIILFTLLFHAVSFRKPFLLTILPIAAYLTYPFCKRHRVFFPILSGVACTALMLGVCKLSTIILPPERHNYPTQVMLISDIKIADILRGDMSTYRGKLESFLDRRENLNEFILQREAMIAAQYRLYNVTTEEDWQNLLRLYTTYAKENPLLLAEARLIQGFAFLSGEHYPNFFRQAIHRIHPHVSPYGKTLNTFSWKEGHEQRECRHAFMLWTAGCLLPFIIILCRKKLFHSTGNKKDTPTLFFLSAACFISLAAYLAVVIPTADYRYRIQSVILAIYSISWCIVYLISPSSQEEKPSLS